MAEVDLTIVRDDCPKLTYGRINTYLADGVFAVIEVKSNLFREKFRESLRKMKSVKELEPNVHIVMKSGLSLERPLRCVFAYEGATFETLLEENSFEDKDVVDNVGVINRGAMIRKELILMGGGNEDYCRIEDQVASIGFLYFEAHLRSKPPSDLLFVFIIDFVIDLWDLII